MKTHRTIRYRLYPATYRKHRQLYGTAGACRHCGHEDNADINAALNIMAAGNTATGHGDYNIGWSVKRQKDRVARRSNKSVKLSV